MLGILSPLLYSLPDTGLALGQALALKKRRAARRQILYTAPVAPRAGESMDIFYNPDATVLRGRPETWLQGSFNR